MVVLWQAVVDGVASLTFSLVILIASAVGQARPHVRAVGVNVTTSVDVLGVGARVVDRTSSAVTIVSFIAVAYRLSRVDHFTTAPRTAATVVGFARVVGGASKTIAIVPKGALATA